jgi:tetrahydromethanopterin S-methyltransferase subunit F
MSKKYERGRQILAEKNLQAADASRYIDDIPTRTELIQYERRLEAC